MSTLQPWQIQTGTSPGDIVALDGSGKIAGPLLADVPGSVVLADGADSTNYYISESTSTWIPFTEPTAAGKTGLLATVRVGSAGGTSNATSGISMFVRRGGSNLHWTSLAPSLQHYQYDSTGANVFALGPVFLPVDASGTYEIFVVSAQSVNVGLFQMYISHIGAVN